MNEVPRDGRQPSVDETASRPDPPPYHHYLLLGSGLSIAFGGLTLTLAERLGWGVYPPIALITAGFGLLGSAIALRPSSRYEPEVGSGVVGPDAVERGTRQSAPPRDRRKLRSAVPNHSGISTRSFSPRQVSGSYKFATTDPVQTLWSSWNPAEGRLPVDLVGPVPETAYTAPRPGRGALHEEGDPILLEPSYFDDENLDWAWGNRALDGLDVPPPPVAVSSAAKSEAAFNPAPLGVSGVREPAPLLPSPGTFRATTVVREAIDPQPPHLRLKPEPPQSRGSISRRHANLPARSGRCADCRANVRDPKPWRKCPDCGHELCTHCIVEALLAYEAGLCTHCAGMRHLDQLSKELGPAGRRARVGSTTLPTSGIVKPKVTTRHPSNGVGLEWKEPEWFVKIPKVRSRTGQIKDLASGPIRARSKGYLGATDRANARRITLNPGRPGSFAAGT